MARDRRKQNNRAELIPVSDREGIADQLEKALQENRALREAIECNLMPYCVYDKDQRLVVFNAAYGQIHPALNKLKSVTGRGAAIHYRDIVRAQLEGTVPSESLDDEVDERVRAQENADGSVVERQYGDKYYRILKFKLPSGGTAGIAFDVSELKAREVELAQQTQKAEDASKEAELALQAECIAKENTQRLAELGEWLQSCQSLDELFEIVERFMSKMFPHTSGELYVYSNSRDVLDGACHWSRKDRLHQHIEPGDCWALRRGRMLHYGSGFAELECTHVADSARDREDVAPYICIPIIAHGDTIGLLHMRLDRPGFDETQLDTSLATQCSEHISLAIANAKLRDELQHQSNRDPLTGLYNRRYFLNTCRTQFVIAEREKTEFSIISLDADHFKDLNDVHGHEAGDNALVAIAKCIRESTTDAEIPARLGGEEFSVLLPNTDLQEARARADALRSSIACLEILYAGVALPQITVSCGVASSKHHGPTPRDVLKAADVALYAAKETGRNTVCVDAPAKAKDERSGSSGGARNGT